MSGYQGIGDIEELRSMAHVSYSHHAISRMSSLHVSEREVLKTILAPTRVLASAPGHPMNRSVYCNGQIRVVLAHGSRVVATVRLNRSYIHGQDTRTAPPLGPEVWLLHKDRQYEKAVGMAA